MNRIADNIYKIKGSSNCYLILDNKKILIDTGSPSDTQIVKKEIDEICGCENIEIVLFTHFHYDHIANWNLFQNAEFYCSKIELQDYEKNPMGAVLNKNILESFKELKNLKILNNNLESLKIIPTPGHTQGSISILYKNILFTGDTYFRSGVFGRIDLPTSNPNAMADSLAVINRLKNIIICSGHDY